ncbi:MAG: cytochrome-c oxidase [Bacteroidetes bacterium]|nr:MAG: cytochrome-c oxidase [Bacteroidota bacterium]
MSNHEHTPSFKSDLITFGLLMLLTAITIWASYATGGTTVLAVLVAMGIATVKATLVVRNFMHIKYDDVIYRIFIGVVIIIFAVFITLLAADYFYR